MNNQEIYLLQNGSPSKNLIVIVGPTASGKTSLAIALAKKLDAEIISADSRQIYREMKIGTARPEQTALQGIPHHLMGTLSVTEDYDAGNFRRDALKVLDEVFSRNDNAILCGGSGLYINAVLHGFDVLPTGTEALRNEINKNYLENGLSWLQNKVQELDPDYFAKVDKQNPQRLMRAIEVCMASGLVYSALRSGKSNQLNCRIVKIGLELEREELYKRIDARMDEMIEQGLFEEAKALYPFKEKNALQTVGYQEIFDFIEDKHDMEETIRLLKRNSRRYAKRQMTWFRRDEEIKWFRPEQFEQILNVVIDN